MFDLCAKSASNISFRDVNNDSSIPYDAVLSSFMVIFGPLAWATLFLKSGCSLSSGLELCGCPPGFRAEFWPCGCGLLSLAGVRDGWFIGSIVASGDILDCPVGVEVTRSRGVRFG